MDEFDKTSFELELADLLEKYNVDLISKLEILIYHYSKYDGYFLSGYITPESLRNGNKA